MKTQSTFCRICSGRCGLLVDIDDDHRITRVRGDKNHAMTQGFACRKGLSAAEIHTGEQRLLMPLERQADGSFKELPLEKALDNIAARLATIVKREGADAVATFRGTQHYANTTAFHMLSAFIRGLGTRSNFSTMTIDQSAKWVVDQRLGAWRAGRQAFHNSDVWMFIGYNPVVSVQGINGFPALNPVKQLKDAKRRGMKIIVIDPRKTETAHYADVHLQIRPGQDAAVLAGLIRIVLTEGWHDKAFCKQTANGLTALQQSVAAYTPERVSELAGINASDLHVAAQLFAKNVRRGIAVGGTGPDMAPFSNLNEHLIEVLNIICGRFLREGEPVPNPGPMSPASEVRAEVIAPKRVWELGRKSRVRGLGRINGEKMSGVLADEILTPGEGQIKALIVDGGNPVNALPERAKAKRALNALELLVCIDPVMSETAELADYIIPPTLMFERPDVPLLFEKTSFPQPFVQYTKALLEKPKGSDVAEDWYVFWGLAKRLKLSLNFAGVELNMSEVPTNDSLLALLLRDAQVPFDKIKQYESGSLIDMPEQKIAPARPDRAQNKFELLPEDVGQELRDFTANTALPTEQFPLQLSVRRSRHVMNTTYRHLAHVRKSMPENPLWINPEDITELGFSSGERVTLQSAYGSIHVQLKADASMRKGVVAIAHGWGGRAGLKDDAEQEVGVSVNDLIPGNERYEKINAMPWFSALPVRVLVSNNDRSG